MVKVLGGAGGRVLLQPAARCADHLEEHAFWRLAANALGGKGVGLAPLEEQEGPCLICNVTLLKERGTADLFFRGVCGLPGHLGCVRDQFCGMDALDREKDCGMICHGCFVERYLEVAIVMTVWDKEGDKSVLVVEGGKDLIDAENATFWKAARLCARERGIVVRPEVARFATVSPFKSLQPANPSVPREEVGDRGRGKGVAVPKVKAKTRGAKARGGLRAGDAAPEAEQHVEAGGPGDVGQQIAEAGGRPPYPIRCEPRSCFGECHSQRGGVVAGPAPMGCGMGTSRTVKVPPTPKRLSCWPIGAGCARTASRRSWRCCDWWG